MLTSMADLLNGGGVCWGLYPQVGDAVDTEFSGFSVPLEHSFEVGEFSSSLWFQTK